jgi:hypothetical protein
MTMPSGGLPTGPAGVPAMPGAAPAEANRPTVSVATYGDYADAQRAIDHLSDQGFPVEHTAIVGTGLRLVERVLGRLTVGRAAVAGLASGAWFGLFVGLLFGLFSDANWLAVVLGGVLIGAVWGAIFGAIAHAATGGRRDFSSRSMLQASEYAIMVTAGQAEEARTLLVRLNWQTHNPS